MYFIIYTNNVIIELERTQQKSLKVILLLLLCDMKNINSKVLIHDVQE